MDHICPNWDYSKVPNYLEILLPRVAALVQPIFSPGFDTSGRTTNTRPAHKSLFKGLTLDLYPHFAGNYRGAEKKDCLEHLRVYIPGDPMVGADPTKVKNEMDALRDLIDRGIAVLDSAIVAGWARADRLLAAIRFGSSVFEKFLRIHPYANGNGHIARYIMWAILGRYGFQVTKRFPIEPRPIDPPYSDCIKAYRRGKTEHLERFVFDCLDPAT